MTTRHARHTTTPTRHWLYTPIAAAIAAHLVADLFITADITGTWHHWTLTAATLTVIQSGPHPRHAGPWSNPTNG